MFDEEDDGAAADALEEEDAAGSDDDAFVVAKPQVSHFTACVKKTKQLPITLCSLRNSNHKSRRLDLIYKCATRFRIAAPCGAKQ
jgi:hypothetical protein